MSTSGFQNSVMQEADYGVDQLLGDSSADPLAHLRASADLNDLNSAVQKNLLNNANNDAVAKLPNVFIAQQFVQDGVGYINPAVAAQADAKFDQLAAQTRNN